MAEHSGELAAVFSVLAEHAIECTGRGEVSCGGCREAGWMTWRAYREHLADAIVASLFGSCEQDGGNDA